MCERATFRYRDRDERRAGNFRVFASILLAQPGYIGHIPFLSFTSKHVHVCSTIARHCRRSWPESGPRFPERGPTGKWAFLSNDSRNLRSGFVVFNFLQLFARNIQIWLMRCVIDKCGSAMSKWGGIVIIPCWISVDVIRIMKKKRMKITRNLVCTI